MSVNTRTGMALPIIMYREERAHVDDPVLGGGLCLAGDQQPAEAPAGEHRSGVRFRSRVVAVARHCDVIDSTIRVAHNIITYSV